MKPGFALPLLAPLLLSLALHGVLLGEWSLNSPPARRQADPVEIRIATPPLIPDTVSPAPTPSRQVATPPRITKAPAHPAPASLPERPASLPSQAPASLDAPPPPSAEEWALASTYTLKNSKRYRYNWGQLVRSMMGTAIEGAGQGVVRFRIEIAPDGTITNIKELWSTSETASKLAWQAIKSLPALPPTPTGKPLIFERTISFQPYETGWPPSYTLDCLPDPPVFRNPFAWDGKSPQAPVERPSARRPPVDTEAAKKCVTDSTAETIEQEASEMRRQVEANRWGS